MNAYDFTKRVRAVLARAREEAARLEHEYVGTEHLLLALARNDEGAAALVLERLNVDREALIRRVDAAVRPGGRPASARGSDLPYTSRARVVLEKAMAAAAELNHSYVDTEHLLLGLILEERGIAAQVLSAVGVTLDVARAELLGVLGVPPTNLEDLGALGPQAVSRVDLTIHVHDGRRFQGSFQTARDAVTFLEMIHRGDGS